MSAHQFEKLSGRIRFLQEILSGPQFVTLAKDVGAVAAEEGHFKAGILGQKFTSQVASVEAVGHEDVCQQQVHTAVALAPKGQGFLPAQLTGDGEIENEEVEGLACLVSGLETGDSFLPVGGLGPGRSYRLELRPASDRSLPAARVVPRDGTLGFLSDATALTGEEARS